jgi:hypothetical protein
MIQISILNQIVLICCHAGQRSTCVMRHWDEKKSFDYAVCQEDAEGL